MEHIDLLSTQRQCLVDREKLVVRNLARLKVPFGSAKKSCLQKYEIEDLETDRRSIRKETDSVDKLICLEFASGARAMRWSMLCIGPRENSTCAADPPKTQRDETAHREAARDS